MSTSGRRATATPGAAAGYHRMHRASRLSTPCLRLTADAAHTYSLFSLHTSNASSPLISLDVPWRRCRVWFPERSDWVAGRVASVLMPERVQWVECRSIGRRMQMQRMRLEHVRGAA